MCPITLYTINYLEKTEKIFNIYVKNEYNKFTENIELNYFTLYAIKNELKLSISLKTIIDNLKYKITEFIKTEPLNIIKDVKTNDDFYNDDKLDKKAIDKIVSNGINDNILYIFYIFNTSYFTKNVIYNNLKFYRNNTSYLEINYISNIIYKYGILRFNNNIVVCDLDNITEDILNNLLKSNTSTLLYNNLKSYDEKKTYNIDYIYMTRNNYSSYRHFNNETLEENDSD